MNEIKKIVSEWNKKGKTYKNRESERNEKKIAKKNEIKLIIKVKKNLIEFASERNTKKISTWTKKKRKKYTKNTVNETKNK